MADTSIEWTDATWTPIRARNRASRTVGWYCEKVSAGCAHCYAEKMNGWRGNGVRYAADQKSKVDIYLDEEMLLAPLKWKNPRMVFACSMTDLFADFVPDVWIDKIMAVMALCPQHTFQCLTKRPERMLGYLVVTPDIRARIAREANALMRSNKGAGNSDALADVFTWGRHEHAEVGEYVNYLAGIADRCWPLPNLWLGVSVEDQPAADERIPLLLETPAAVRWISAEPLLGPVSLDTCAPYVLDGNEGNPGVLNAFNAKCHHPATVRTAPTLQGNDQGIRWVVCGGESGPHARPMYSEWARSLRDQCVAASVPYFFKQYGEWVDAGHPLFGRLPERRLCYIDSYGRVLDPPPSSEDADCVTMKRVGKKAAGRLLDGRLWNEYPKISESNPVAR